MKTIKQNFLIFRGTYDEVCRAENIDRCFYLAWDTGELFVGNPNGGKTKYGGNKTTLSEKEIKDYIDRAFQTYQDEIVENNKIIIDIRNQHRINNDKITQLIIDTDKHIEDRINEMFNNPTELSKLFITRDELKKYNYVSKPELDKYVSYADSNALFICPKKGKELITLLNKEGYYLCVEDFINPSDNSKSFYKGNTYHILGNGVFEQIASSGGGGNIPVDPSLLEFGILHFDIDKYDKNIVFDISENIFKNSNISITAKFKNASKASNIALMYQLIENGNILPKANIPTMPSFDFQNNQNVFTSKDSVHLKPGRNNFILSALLRDGSTKEQTLSFDIVRPFFYGTGPDVNIDNKKLRSLYSLDEKIVGISIDDLIKSLTKVSKVVNPETEEYSMTLTMESHYIWFCIPAELGDSMLITKIYDRDSGETFGNIPFITFDIDYTDENGYISPYKVYRTNGIPIDKETGSGLINIGVKAKASNSFK